MELWIRSQDREDLVKVNALWIMDNQIWMEVPFYDNHKKLGLTVTSNNHRLGVYKNKERALEVLDEIQDRLISSTSIEKSRLCLKNGYDELKIPYEKSIKVYQMPLE